MKTGGNGINGLPAVSFDGSNDGLKTSSTPTGMLNAVSGATVFIIGKNIDTGTGIDRHAMFISTSSSGSGRAYARLAVTTRLLAIGGRRLDADTAATVTGGSAVDTNNHIWIFDYDYANAQVSVYQDGTRVVGPSAFQTAGSTSATNPADLTLGNNTGLTNGWHGLIAEAGVVNNRLSNAQRALLDSYAQDTYAITVADYLPGTDSAGLVDAGTSLDVSELYQESEGLADTFTASTQHVTSATDNAGLTDSATPVLTPGGGTAWTVTQTDSVGQSDSATEVKHGRRIFKPPTYQIQVLQEGLRYKLTEGLSVIKSGGVYTQTQYPTTDAIASAEKVYMGGYEYTLTSAEEAELTAAGFGSYIVDGS